MMPQTRVQHRNFIVYLLIASSITWLGAKSFAEEPAQPIPWTPAMEVISGPDEDRTLVLMLVTNDNAYAEPSYGWCTAALDRRIPGLLRERPGLRDTLRLQRLPAGLPACLTGGESRSGPGRAIVLVADNDYRLLSFAVGIPSSEELQRIVEDAEQVRSQLAFLQRESRAALEEAVAERSAERVRRVWKEAIEATRDTLPGVGDVTDDGVTSYDWSDQAATRVATLTENWESVYLADVVSRFGLTDVSDRQRLVILEQHLETRANWCDAMLPFLAGGDVRALWQPLAEAVWKLPAVRRVEPDTELLLWWDEIADTQPVVISLQPSLLAARQAWPPPQLLAQTGRRGATWTDLQAVIQAQPIKDVSAAQLAALITARGLRDVEIALPSTARYLFYEPKQKSPLVIREDELPGRYVAKIKRAVK